MEPWGTTEGFTQPPLTWSSGILWDGKAFATWDMSQEPKAELRGLSHPCCCLRRELGNPLLWVWDICPGFFCRLCDCLRKCSYGALHQLTTPAAEKEQLCAHSSARSAQREVSSLALPQTRRTPHQRQNPSLGSKRDEQMEALPLLLSFLTQNSSYLCYIPSCSQLVISNPQQLPGTA